MNILSVENVSKHFNEKLLFQNITFGIDENDKIGLIGINGTGKSTLLKVLAGVEPADEGRVVVGNDIHVEFLAQNPEFDDEATVLQQVFKGQSPIMQTLREYEETLEELTRRPQDEQLQKRMMSLSQRMEALGAWQFESEAKAILTRLGITDFTARVGTLSGGQRKRIALASALITPADLLILDEPTNQIDTGTVDWLEDYLNRRKGALIMVTHDRYFLDRITNRIVELDRAKLYTYTGNYSTFLEKKVEREEIEQAIELKRENILRNELSWIQRGCKARSTKQKARIQRFEKLMEDKPDARGEKLEISVGMSRLGKKVIELIDVSKAYDGVELFQAMNYIFQRDDRIGIVGPNGSGKSTLLNIIAGRLAPDEGSVEIGQTVKIGFYAQETTEMDEEMRVIDYIKEGGEYIPTAEGGSITASQMLERFLFPPAAQWNFIANLSGGERRRLYLLRVLMEAPNVLLLDEPTNDLDIQTLSILEEYLDDFPGALIVVSHDRYFLDRVVERIIAFESEGEVNSYVGNYSDYLEKHEEALLLAEQAREEKARREEKAKAAETKPAEKKERSLKFTFKEQKEYEVIDEKIAELEARVAAVTEKVNTAGGDYVLLQQLTAEQEELEQQLEATLERWMYLNEIAEAMANNK